ncbi:MAG: glycine cleavage system aminomethyltransferase GcvT [bacterium]
MEPQKTALYDVHKNLGAKIVEFAGYLMPVQYKGIKEEHFCVRHSVGIFDVSHMGEVFIRGKRATEYLQRITVNDVTRLQQFRAQYTGMCFEHGGMVDDMIVYCFGDHYMAIVNAANRGKDYDWMKQNLIQGVELEDRSDEISLFAVQGRNAEKTLQKLTKLDLSEIKFYWFREGTIAGEQAFIARTGYTGEDGFEVGVDADRSVTVWNAILEAGAEFGIQPVGLAARDTLRLEMKYCLYGNDIDETTNPIEAGLGWITKVDKGDFIGRDAIMKVKQQGPSRKLVGFEMKERAVPRQGYTIFKEGSEIGVVTSGTFSPSLERGIGVGYVTCPHHEVGTPIAISVRGKRLGAQVVKTPFYQRPY